MHDAGDRGAVLGADDQHVAAVAVGDDLLLQVLRRVLAAQVGLERAAQPRALLAQPIADAPQLRARVVHHLAARIDLAAHVGDLALERRGGLDDRGEQRERGAGAADAAGGWPQRIRGTSRARAGAAVRARALRRRALRGSRPVRRARAARSRRFPRETAPLRPSSPARAPPSPASCSGCSRASRSRAGRRLREPRDGRDDAIEFEGLEGSGMHGSGLRCNERNPQVYASGWSVAEDQSK